MPAALSFTRAALELSRNPSGFPTLCLLFALWLAEYLRVPGLSDWHRTLLVGFVTAFPCGLLAVFYRLTRSRSALPPPAPAATPAPAPEPVPPSEIRGQVVHGEDFQLIDPPTQANALRPAPGHYDAHGYRYFVSEKRRIFLVRTPVEPLLLYPVLRLPGDATPVPRRACSAKVRALTEVVDNRRARAASSRRAK